MTTPPYQPVYAPVQPTYGQPPTPFQADPPAGPRRPEPASVQAGFAPVQRRLSPGQVWTLVATGVIAVVATVVGVLASGPGEPSMEDRLRDAGIYGDYSDYSG